MKKIKYPLIVSDCDGTILNSQHAIGEFTKEKILQYVEDGGIFAVSTGRMIASILPVVRAWGLNGVVSAFQGGVIMDIQTERILHESAIPHKTALQICKHLENLGLHIHTYSLWQAYTNMVDEWTAVYEKIVGEKMVYKPKMSAFLEESKLAPYKFLMMVDPKDAKRVCKAIAEILPDECFVTTSAPFLVEVGLKNATKRKAVTFLADYYGIPLEKTIAVGDQLNDLPMIEVAGLGVAVASADPELKEKAYVLPYTNDEDAVGRLIEEIAYTEE
jgi:Cof subfamily protein (haloacid dehalogenase superfamily)